MRSKIILFFLVSISILAFADAKGLVLFSTNSSYQFNLSSSTMTMPLVLRNTENFIFYNITFDTPSGTSINKVNILNPNEEINITLTINSENSINGAVKVKGLYISQIGASNQTYNITVDYYSGLSICDITIIKGDSIQWYNMVNDDIILRNSQTYNDIVTILINSTYTTKFDSPTTLSYFALRRGYIFTNPCTITCLDDSGLVHNPEYDNSLNVSIQIFSSPTLINSVILQRDYNISLFTSQDGLMSITNTGSNKAKNIVLSGEWFTFNSNNFDILPGQTKAISYTITPSLSNSNDTGKTYNKTFSISGNFPVITESFNIYIPYMNLDNPNSTSQFQSFVDMIKAWCVLHPQESFCQTTPQTVYIYSNKSNEIFNVSFEKDQVKGIFDYVFKIGDDMHITQTYNKEVQDAMNQKMISMESKLENMTVSLLSIDEERKQNTSFLIFTFIAGGFILLIGLSTVLILIYRKINVVKKVEVWQ